MLNHIACVDWDAVSPFLSLKDYYYAILGAGIGAWIGITVEKQREKRKRRLADQNARLGLKAALEKIVELAGQARNEFQKNRQPNFPLETQRAAVLCDRISVFRDTTLRTAIEGLLYQCSHYNAKLLVVNSAYMTALISNANTAAIMDPYSTMMIQHLQEITDWTQSILDRLPKESG
jgi:hypothetical protein